MTRKLKTIALMLGLAFPFTFVMPALAQEEAAEEAGDTGGATGIAAVWNKNCASCHGKDGKGQTKAGKTKKVQDLTDAAVRAKFDRERMIKATKEGIKDEAGKDRMKAYAGKLSDEEIAQLIDYIVNTLK